jgi:hypothetical protein
VGTFWKHDWDQARQNLTRWWRRQGLALSITAPAHRPHADLQRPLWPEDHNFRWTNPGFRFARAEFELSQQFFGGEAFPFFDTQMGPGSLGMFLGSQPEFVLGTVWYHPCIEDLGSHPKLGFDPVARWFQAQAAVVDEGVRRGDGRFLVGMPDLIENIDTLAQLRGAQTLLVDMIEVPELIEQRLWEINDAFFAAFDALFARIRDDMGGNAFSAFRIWGPGKTAKLQCDASAMFSPQMFRRFVVPPLSKQCEWLDFSLYHLDGTQALHHVPALLEIEALDAIQWTPQAGHPTGGNRQWFDLYRRIKSAGKGVQVFDIALDEVIPLLDAAGPEGLFIITRSASSQDEAERLLEQVATYRTSS